jgi:MobA/MobL family
MQGCHNPGPSRAAIAAASRLRAAVVDAVVPVIGSHRRYRFLSERCGLAGASRRIGRPPACVRRSLTAPYWQAAGLRPSFIDGAVLAGRRPASGDIRRRTYKQRLLLSLVCGTVGRGGIAQGAWSSGAGGRVAIYHLRAQVIARSAGRSVVAAAAYRHRTRMLDERTGTDHRFDRNEIVAHAEMALPAETPAWLRAPAGSGERGVVEPG